MRNRDGTDTEDCLAQKPTFVTTVLYSSSPQALALQTVLWKTIFPWVGVEDGFRMIQYRRSHVALRSLLAECEIRDGTRYGDGYQ